ncbi:MAG: DUF5627 domain-containing protein [Dysgonamonadaceae bacterium]|jgi:hypothetical protein|nr:DUF5627 domain-containing protein [Dysgonamonadaceae bacterium]
MRKLILFSLVITVLTSCHNDDWEFPDYEYNAVYFSYQYPVRTLTMGEDLFDTSLDNAHKCKIMATWGGGYSNKENVVIDFVVDNSLCNNLTFKDNGADVLPMPSNYYTLASNKITIPAGTVSGGVEVQLTDAFFADPLALHRNYVIPLVLTHVQNADSILKGKTDLPDANRCVADNWEVAPKDYILYAVKYINTWDGNYLRRGKDVVTKGANTENVLRHERYVEDDEICKLSTISLSELEFPLVFKDESGNDINVSLALTFDNEGNCAIASRSANATATGSGKFVKKGDKNSWGDKDRDVLYLQYNVDVAGTQQYSTADTLVVRDRGVKMETFEVVLK